MIPLQLFYSLKFTSKVGRKICICRSDFSSHSSSRRSNLLPLPLYDLKVGMNHIFLKIRFSYKNLRGKCNQTMQIIVGDRGIGPDDNAVILVVEDVVRRCPSARVQKNINRHCPDPPAPALLPPPP